MNFSIAGIEIRGNNDRDFVSNNRCIWPKCEACSLNNPPPSNDDFYIDYDMFFGEYEDFSATTSTPLSTDEYCELCGNYFPEGELSRHQCQRFWSTRATNRYKKLTDNVSNGETSKKVNGSVTKELLYVCKECEQKVWTEELQQHHSRYHPNVPSDVDIYQIADEKKEEVQTESEKM